MREEGLGRGRLAVPVRGRAARPRAGAPGAGQTELMDDGQVAGEEDGRHQRQDQDMHAEEPAERGVRDVDPAAQQLQERLPDDRHATGDLGADDGRPEGPLVPGQQVAGEAEADGHGQQADAHQPGDLARVLVGALDEDPRQVEDQEDDHQVGSPVVDAPDEPAELDARW